MSGGEERLWLGNGSECQRGDWPNFWQLGHHPHPPGKNPDESDQSAGCGPQVASKQDWLRVKGHKLGAVIHGIALA